MKKNKDYLFILRAWTEAGVWRWSLLENGTAERVGFSDLDSLYLYLSSLTADALSTPKIESAADNNKVDE